MSACRLQFSWKAVPQVLTGSCKTPVSIVAVGLSHSTRPWCGRTQLTTAFIGDQLAVGGQIGWHTSCLESSHASMLTLCWQALIGTYRCTDVPGQFVWQPGSLLCAVSEGHWLLLEDLDCAPMDIVSVLVPLLETGKLSVPGHGGEVRAAPSFRFFATRRWRHRSWSVLVFISHYHNVTVVFDIYLWVHSTIICEQPPEWLIQARPG